jgi:hypothetical protein
VVISGSGDWFAQEKWSRQRRVRSIRAQRVFGCLRGLARIDQHRQALLQIRSEAMSNLGQRVGLLSASAGSCEFRSVAIALRAAKNLVQRLSRSPTEGLRGQTEPLGEIALNSAAPPVLLSPRQLAARWGLSEKTLERWRMLGTGPVFLKLGGRVLYRIDEVEAHEQQRTRRCTAGRAVAEALL